MESEPMNAVSGVLYLGLPYDAISCKHLKHNPINHDSSNYAIVEVHMLHLNHMNNYCRVEKSFH